MKKLLFAILFSVIAAPVCAAPYVPAKTFAPGEAILSADFNTMNSRIASAVNNIDPATQINDSSITSAQIAKGGIILDNLAVDFAFVSCFPRPLSVISTSTFRASYGRSW